MNEKVRNLLYYFEECMNDDFVEGKYIISETILMDNPDLTIEEKELFKNKVKDAFIKMEYEKDE